MEIWEMGGWNMRGWSLITIEKEGEVVWAEWKYLKDVVIKGEGHINKIKIFKRIFSIIMWLVHEDIKFLCGLYGVIHYLSSIT